MNNKNYNYDLIIIGGGAAGMMAAISAKKKHPAFKIAIIDRTFALGRKILVCGAGRCNITNINLNDSIQDHYYGARPEFIQKIFNQFGYQQIVDFFNELGINLYVERKTDIGKLFPTTDQAKTVSELLLDELQTKQVEIMLNTECSTVTKRQDLFLISATNLTTQQTLNLTSNYLIISAGGKTYPALGSNGSGYLLASQLGHKIVEPVPSALPLESKNQLSHLLQGTRVEAEVTSIINHHKIKTRTDEVMFTKYGFSGPAILNVSREISLRINREHLSDCMLMLNLLPGYNKQTARQFLYQRWQKRPAQRVEKSLYGILPNKAAAAICEISQISKDLVVKDLTDQEINRLIDNLTAYQVKITQTRGWNEAEFTAGGVDTEQVDQKLKSKLVASLYFAGEILNVDGDVGGFNLSWAWSSGWVAGQLG